MNLINEPFQQTGKKLPLNVENEERNSKQFRKDDMNIIINLFQAHITNVTQFFGVFIDDKLSWKKHKSYISNISKHKNLLEYHINDNHACTRKHLFSYIMHWYFSYCIYAWIKAHANNIKSLEWQKSYQNESPFHLICSHKNTMITKCPILKL